MGKVVESGAEPGVVFTFCISQAHFLTFCINRKNISLYGRKFSTLIIYNISAFVNAVKISDIPFSFCDLSCYCAIHPMLVDVQVTVAVAYAIKAGIVFTEFQ